MAQELTINLSLAYSKQGTQGSMSSGTQKFTVLGTNYARLTMSVPTTTTALPLGSIATPGYCIITNRDNTNYVEVYTDTGGSAALKLKPGEWAVFRFGVSAPAVKAHTSACIIEYLLIED